MRRSALSSLLAVLIVALAALPALAGGMGHHMKMGDSVSVTGGSSAC